jgi:type II secretory pathway component PulL
MADALFCLDIHKDSVTALVVDANSKITRVTGCGTAVTLDQSFEDAIAQIKEQTGYPGGGQCLVTFGAEFFSFRNVFLPFSDRKKIEQALPFELVDHSPVDINSLLIDFIVAKSEPESTEIVAAMISREDLAAHLSLLNAAGINPNSIGISGLSTALKIAEGPVENFLLIDIGTCWATLFIVRKRQVTLIRSLAILPEVEGGVLNDDVFIQNVKQTVHASHFLNIEKLNFKVYLTGSDSRIQTASPMLSPLFDGAEIDIFKQSAQPFIKIEPDVRSSYRPELMDRILAHVFKNGKKSGGFNFRKDDFRKKKSLREYRDLLLKVAVPLCIVIISVSAYAGYEFSSLNAEQERLRQQITAVFKETLPEVTRIVNPVQQLQVKNNEIRRTYSPGGAGYTIIEILTELSARIPAKYSVKVVRMVADMNTIRLKAVTGDFNTVDNVQKELEKSQYFSSVVISSANQSVQGDEVNFELKLELAR